MRTTTYNLNLRVGAGIPPIVKVSQNDEGRSIGFRLFEGALSYFPGATAEVTITGTKPSGLGFTETCIVSGSLAVVETTLAMTQESGQINAELRISDGTLDIGTSNFILSVEPAPHQAGTTDGTTEEARTVLEQCAQYAQEAHEAASDVAPQVESLVDAAVADKMEEIEDAVQSVTDAATQAVSDITAAGEAVEESIPADYTALSTQVSQLQADLDDVNESLANFQVEGEITDYTISQGTINRTYGYDIDSDVRCRTNVIAFDASKMVVTPKSGYKVGGRTYNKASGSSFEGSQEFTETELVYTDATKFYRFVIGKTDDSNITPATIPEDAITVKCYDSTDKSLSIDGKSADAGAVGAMVEFINSQVDDLSQKIGFTVEKHIDSWESGTINTSTGVLSGAKSNRSYTNKLHFDDTVDNKVTICTSNDYALSIRAYKRSDDSYMGMPFDGFVTGEYEFMANPEWYYRFVLARTDNADFAEKNVVYTDAYFTFTTANEQLDVIKRNNAAETVALLQQLIRKTRTGHDAYGKNPLCFIHFSDVHGDSACLANIVRFKNEYADYISDILHTGDSVYYSFVDGMGFWDCIDGAESILNVIGNHDTKASKSGEWTGLSMAEAYAAYMAPYISNWGATYTADKTYYYKDYVTEGVRLIVLDIMHQTAEQLSWFESTLESARVAELDVVVAEHARAHWLFEANSSVWDDKVNVPEYSSGYSDTSSYTGSNYPSCMSDDYASAVDDFIDAGGYFICWLHGHTHFRILAHLQTHNRQLDVSVANTGRPGFAQTYVWERVADTKSMDDFNVVAIDTTGKILRVAKFGVNTDRLMRVAHTLSYNYSTHTVINAN